MAPLVLVHSYLCAGLCSRRVRDRRQRWCGRSERRVNRWPRYRRSPSPRPAPSHQSPTRQVFIVPGSRRLAANSGSIIINNLVGWCNQGCGSAFFFLSGSRREKLKSQNYLVGTGNTCLFGRQFKVLPVNLDQLHVFFSLHFQALAPSWRLPLSPPGGGGGG